MRCLWEHNWSWPRRRGSKDIQICLACCAERESKVRFSGPRFRLTQPGAFEPGMPPLVRGETRQFRKSLDSAAA